MNKIVAMIVCLFPIIKRCIYSKGWLKLKLVSFTACGFLSRHVLDIKAWWLYATLSHKDAAMALSRQISSFHLSVLAVHLNVLDYRAAHVNRSPSLQGHQSITTTTTKLSHAPF